MSMRTLEQAVLLGNRKSMVGVVTSPAVGRDDLPTVVILNAGIIHRAGPNRLSVLLARALAASGCVVLRFDLSGIGDSEPRPDGLPPLEASLADIREALDWLQSTRHARRIVLIGLCSGADHSALYGGTDPRVVGAVLIDPSMPRTRGYYLRHYGRRLFRLRSWFSLVSSLVSAPARGRKVTVSEPEVDASGPNIQDPEVRAFLERRYQAAVDNGVHMLTVLTGGLEHVHNYREQFVDAFAKVTFRNSLRVEYFADADHTFETETERTRLINMIVQWTCQTAFAGADVRENGQTA